MHTADLPQVVDYTVHMDIHTNSGSPHNVQHSLILLYLSLYMMMPTPSDINECELDLNNCDVNAECNDTEGSYTCRCDLGFTGNGFSCSKYSYHNDSWLQHSYSNIILTYLLICTP